MKKVCVIGSGASGLTAIKQLMDEGHQVTCYEKSNAAGGVFNYGGPNGRSIKSTVLTISNYLMAFSDDPPKGHRYFWSHEEYRQYLANYAKKFGLLEKIVFDTEVVKLRKQGEQYQVITRHNPTQTLKTENYEAVVICSGIHETRKIPPVPSIETFTGDIVHTQDFTDPTNAFSDSSAFTDKRVLCVGIGESAADIIREVSKVTADCHLLMRSYPFLVPRVLHDTTADCTTTRAFHATYHPSENIIYYRLGSWMLKAASLFEKLLPKKKQPALDAFNQPLEKKSLDFDTEYNEESLKLIKVWNQLSGGRRFSTKNVSFVPQVLNGNINVVVSSLKGISGNTVTFNDGRSVEVDSIIFNTGFQHDLSFIEGFELKDSSVRNMFMHTFHADWPNCAFIGWARPTSGGIPACAEMTARYFALLLNGKRSLPADVPQRIEADKAFYKEALSDSPEIHSLILWKRYMDSYADLIGVRVRLWKYLLNPGLFLRLLYGTMLPVQYRLEGPHASPDTAKQTIMNLPLLNQLPFSLNDARNAIKAAILKKSNRYNESVFEVDFFPECQITEKDIEKYRFSASTR